MTTTELEKKLKISEKTCIHCPTEELAKQVLNIFHRLGLKWCNEEHYNITCTKWDSFKENTVYYPFEGEFSSLSYARLIGYKIISAEEFIALHIEGAEFIALHIEGAEFIALPTEGKEFITLPTEEEEFDLQSYEPKGDLEGFPKEIISRMLECQEEQGNERNVTVFEKWIEASQFNEGFAWDKTKEDREFWDDVIRFKDFNLFFEKYPKQDYQELKNNKNMQENNKEDNSQEFRVGDEVIDIILGQKGKIHQKSTDDNSISPIYVSFNDGNITYTLDGRYYIHEKRPRLLHYRDDYNYDVIDFNNLPKRQDKRWRAKVGETYYFFTSNFEVEKYYDHNDYSDNKAYDSGNYFRTEVEAKNIAQKLNTYFKQLITKLI